MNGQRNIAIGFLTMGAFMLYGFLLIYLRDFAPDKQNGQGRGLDGKPVHALV